MSLLNPEIPSKPDFLFNNWSSSSGFLIILFLHKYIIIPGSIVPDLVPIIGPSNGVNPILVSKEIGFLFLTLTAVIDIPLPK